MQIGADVYCDTQVILAELEPGSLLSMSHLSQLNYEHGIPKTRAPVGPRISVVYRVRPPSELQRTRRADVGAG